MGASDRKDAHASKARISGFESQENYQQHNLTMDPLTVQKEMLKSPLSTGKPVPQQHYMTTGQEPKHQHAAESNSGMTSSDIRQIKLNYL